MTGDASGTGSDEAVLDWLLDSDPSIRWQVMRDLVGAPPTEWQAERERVETERWGARLLALEDDDGQWAGGSFAPNTTRRRRRSALRVANT